MNPSKLGRIALFTAMLCALLCACGNRATVCGVPYEDCTPWELAARIDADGDGTFVPEAVDYIGSSKAIITGWCNPAPNSPTDHLFPDTIFCDLHHGQVVHAVVASTIK